MDLRHLQTLVILAEELHFGRAARRLHVVQSAVTRTLQDLEEKVGAQLLHRSKRRVELTPAGEALARRAREILAAADQAAVECRCVSEGKLGRLRIAVAGLGGLGYLPEALRTFRRQHPAVEIELARMGTAEQVTALLGGRLDVAFTHAPILDDDIVAEPLFEERLLAILPDDHPCSRAPKIRAERMLDEVVAILSRASEPEIYRSLAAYAHREDVPMPRVIEVEDVAFMLTLVAAGLAVSHLPESAARIGYRGVVAIPVDPVYSVTLFAMRRKEHASPVAELLIGALRPR